MLIVKRTLTGIGIVSLDLLTLFDHTLDSQQTNKPQKETLLFFVLQFLAVITISYLNVRSQTTWFYCPTAEAFQA